MKVRPSARVARAIRGDLALAKKLDRSLRGLESEVKTTKKTKRLALLARDARAFREIMEELRALAVAHLKARRNP